MACARQPAAAAPGRAGAALRRGVGRRRGRRPARACRPPRSRPTAKQGWRALRSILRRRGRPEDLLPAALADPARDLPAPAGPAGSDRPGATGATAPAPAARCWPGPPAAAVVAVGAAVLVPVLRSDSGDRLPASSSASPGAARLAGPRIARRRRGPAALRPAQPGSTACRRRSGPPRRPCSTPAVRTAAGSCSCRAPARPVSAGSRCSAAARTTRPRSSCSGPSRSAGRPRYSPCGAASGPVRLLGPPRPQRRPPRRRPPVPWGTDPLRRLAVDGGRRQRAGLPRGWPGCRWSRSAAAPSPGSSAAVG